MYRSGPRACVERSATGGSADLLRAPPDAFTQRFGESGVVEYANAVGVQKTRHAPCVARAGQRARDQDSVKARQHAMQIRRVTFNQIGLHGSLRHRMATQHIHYLFGSGSSGLGPVRQAVGRSI
jgi:hypothetical protein